MTNDRNSCWFIDANIFVFAANPLSPWHMPAVSRLRDADRQGISFLASPQVIREFIAAASRPSPNGPQQPLGPILENAQRIRASVTLLGEDATTVARLVELLNRIPAYGRQVHDANIVATMLTNGVSTLLTHNVADFARYAELIQIEPLE
jgi:predicted nucleic acid-binding protein